MIYHHLPPPPSMSLAQTEKKMQKQSNNEITAWKSEGRQEAYSSNLFQALRQVGPIAGTSSHSARLRGRAVRETADRALAMAAKGRTRWSRAILSNKLEHKFMKSNLRRKKPGIGILRLKSKNLPAVQRKTRDLGRLVPGCRKQPLHVVLEEVAEYIAALEMQVKAMAALANIFSVGSNSGSVFATGAVNLNLLSLRRRQLPSS